jgi:hypothetical protein
METGKKEITYIRDIHTRPKTTVLDTIHHEYCLKRNQFHPAQPSPNLFCNRLEIRMKAYYKDLYKSFNA